MLGDEEIPAATRHAARALLPRRMVPGRRPSPQTPRLVYGNFDVRPAHELRHALEALGITMNTTVVVFTQNFKEGFSDPISAARAI